MRVPKEKKNGRILRNALRQNRQSPYPSNSAPNCCLPWYHNRVQMPKTKGKTKEKMTKKKKKKQVPSKVVFLQNYDNKNGKNV